MVLTAWLRPAAAVLVTVAAGVVALAPQAPAAAAACPGSAGVTVVIEYGALGGGTDVSCDAEGGGRTADRLLKDTGHALTYLQRFPGFVCRIDGVPADDPCVNTPPADAYWGLWWSDGTSGRWSYSSLAAGSLSIPAGGYVAMVWDGSAGDVRPTTAAAPHPSPTPTPTPTPTREPSATQAPTSAPTATTTATATPEPTAGPSRSTTAPPTKHPTKRPTKQPMKQPTKQPTKPSTGKPSTSAEPEPTSDPSPSEDVTAATGPVEDPIEPAAADDGAGLPAWVAPVVVLVLLGAAGGVALARRRQRP